MSERATVNAFFMISPEHNSMWTVAWAQPGSAGSGRIVSYTVVARETDITCTVSGAGGLSTFATCENLAGSTQSLSGFSVTATNSFGLTSFASYPVLLVTGIVR